MYRSRRSATCDSSGSMGAVQGLVSQVKQVAEQHSEALRQELVFQPCQGVAVPQRYTYTAPRVLGVRSDLIGANNSENCKKRTLPAAWANRMTICFSDFSVTAEVDLISWTDISLDMNSGFESSTRSRQLVTISWDENGSAKPRLKSGIGF